MSYWESQTADVSLTHHHTLRAAHPAGLHRTVSIMVLANVNPTINNNVKMISDRAVTMIGAVPLLGFSPYPVMMYSHLQRSNWTSWSTLQCSQPIGDTGLVNDLNQPGNSSMANTTTLLDLSQVADSSSSTIDSEWMVSVPATRPVEYPSFAPSSLGEEPLSEDPASEPSIAFVGSTTPVIAPPTGPTSTGDVPTVYFSDQTSSLSEWCFKNDTVVPATISLESFVYLDIDPTAFVLFYTPADHDLLSALPPLDLSPMVVVISPEFPAPVVAPTPSTTVIAVATKPWELSASTALEDVFETNGTQGEPPPTSADSIPESNPTAFAIFMGCGLIGVLGIAFYCYRQSWINYAIALETENSHLRKKVKFLVDMVNDLTKKADDWKNQVAQLTNIVAPMKVKIRNLQNNVNNLFLRDVLPLMKEKKQLKEDLPDAGDLPEGHVEI